MSNATVNKPGEAVKRGQNVNKVKVLSLIDTSTLLASLNSLVSMKEVD